MMLAYDELCNHLFNEFLATCGDYNTQVSKGGLFLSCLCPYAVETHDCFPLSLRGLLCSLCLPVRTA